mgnify:FL=1
MKQIINEHRIAGGIPFTEVLRNDLPFTIASTDMEAMGGFHSEKFCFGRAEYGPSLETFLQHHVLTTTSEQAVVVLDGMWQDILKQVANVQVCLDQHDASSIVKARPDFTALHQNVLVMKGEAKITALEMNAKANELVNKFHKTAYKMFPKGCNSIPAVMTSNEMISLYSVQYFNKRYTKAIVKEYNVENLGDRVQFVVDLFKILIWVMSQVEPVEGLHLVPDVRTRTPNGHHVTLTECGIFKEFRVSSDAPAINMDALKKIYEAKLHNVEYGTVNCTSVTIHRVGSRLQDALRARTMNKQEVYQQVQQGLEQLHSLGYSHCDVCMDNVFVDFVEDGGVVFLGDLEYCTANDDAPPTHIKRADKRAKTAIALDGIQLQKFLDELNQ